MDEGTDGDRTATATRLMNEAAAGNERASAELLPLVYDQLRRLARRKVRDERAGQTLQATALVHEAYLRLVGPRGDKKWDGRGHFFAAAAEAMRRILIDNARRRDRLKRGGGARTTRLDEMQITIKVPADDLLALDEALTNLTQKHPDKAELVKLRYFAGLYVIGSLDTQAVIRTNAGGSWSTSDDYAGAAGTSLAYNAFTVDSNGNLYAGGNDTYSGAPPTFVRSMSAPAPASTSTATSLFSQTPIVSQTNPDLIKDVMGS